MYINVSGSMDQIIIRKQFFGLNVEVSFTIIYIKLSHTRYATLAFFCMGIFIQALTGRNTLFKS